MSGLIPMDKQRIRLCLEVAWEIDAMARALPGLVSCVADGTPDPHFVVRAMTGRLLRLSGVLMGMADNEAADDLMQVIDLQSGQG
ncbi:MAG: hypothetical protein KKG12_09050 [Gammaproteobacteria bacterium]|nr:hypothetical protein [Gammaproteobacteria bacterium]